MAERHNTLVCSFDPSSPRITAYDIHECIYASLRIPEHKVHMIQIVGLKRLVYIRRGGSESVLALLRDTGRQVEYKYPTGEPSIASLAMAGMGTKPIRIANLPPEVPNDTLRATLAPFGKDLYIQAEMWSKVYRYSVSNSIRLVTIMLTRHVTSHLNVAGYRGFLSYEGQPDTWYSCGEDGHMYQGCTTRQRAGMARPNPAKATHASIVTANVPPTGNPTIDITTEMELMLNQGEPIHNVRFQCTWPRNGN